MTMEQQQSRVEQIARATLGYRIYLHKVVNGYYWSDWPEDHESDETNGVFFETPAKALATVLEASDFLNDPATGEPMILVIR